MKNALIGTLLTLMITGSAIAATDEPRPDKLRQTVEKLVTFGTRHTLSGITAKDGRGIDDARAWIASELRAIAKACKGCLIIGEDSQRFTGPRAPDGAEVVNVFAIQPGSGDSSHVVIVAGHYDSRVTDPLDFTKDAPGANDNGSGSALVIEAARILSKEKFQATIVYALLAGEEQGLWGGQMLARMAKERRWKVAAMLNNDIVGGTKGQDGRVVSERVRIFSEGIRFSESQGEALARRGNGGEDDGPSRALAKAAKRVAERNAALGLEAFLVRRPDRFSRGGDHLPALEYGYPAIRFTVGVEDWDAQHQDLRTEGGTRYGDTADKMDFGYLARVTALNMALIRELAAAPPAPANVTISGALGVDTKVSWAAVPGAAGYRIRWRRNDRADWEESQDVTGAEAVLPGLIVDDYFVGVAALAKDGAESIVTFGGAPGR